FARVGKRSLHLLDLIFPTGADAAARPGPGLSGRRSNRAALKRRLLRDLWEEAVDEPEAGLILTIPPEIRIEMERRLI
ncbi:hypothetical protein KC217_24275, partial [Mycobacterium tuberculosis]|nr:hypothetical protein [Mycobacterium tuberculosis]